MAKVEKIDKWLDSAEKAVTSKSKDGKGAKPIQEASKKSGQKSGYKSFIPANELVNRIQMLLKECPDSPIFFGKKKLKVKERKKKIFRRKIYPDLTHLRIDLNKLSASGKADTLNRQKVRTDLKNYPEVPDLHVINAIYTYQDTPRQDKNAIVSQISQNKLNEAQLTQLRKAIDEIVLAFHNGGLNVFNLNWFVKIYVDYLNVYKTRLGYEYASIAGRNDKQLQTLSQNIRSKQAAITSLLTIKDKMGGIARLSRRLNGTTYLSDSFDILEIKKAAYAVQNSDPTKIVGQDRVAGKTLFVFITLLFLMARIPILKDLLESILSEIPDEDKGIRLRKRMVHTIMLTTEFEMALAGNDIEKKRQAGDNLFGYCMVTINQYTKGGVLKEQYEVDPYLKAIWVIKTVDGLYAPQKYKEMISHGYKMIETLSGDQNYLREPHRETIVDIAKKYLYQLDSIMEYHGWLGKNEAESWQNRE